MCSKLTIKIPERRQWRHSGVFIVNFKRISHIILVKKLSKDGKKFPTVFFKFMVKSMENNTNVLLFLQVHFHTAPVNTLEQ